jgi:hypothetical protein
MNFRVRGGHSVILMSLRLNAPYHDRVEENGTVLIYEGHDISRAYNLEPKSVDQPLTLPSGKLTDNGKFHQAAQEYKAGKKAQILSVYTKRLRIESGQTMAFSTWWTHG